MSRTYVTSPRSGRLRFRAFRRGRVPVSRPCPNQARRTRARSQQTRPVGPPRARTAAQRQPDCREPHASWQHTPVQAPATDHAPRPAPLSTAPPEPHEPRTDDQPPRALGLPQGPPSEAAAPPTPARPPQRHMAAAGPKHREAEPGERGLQCPGHDHVSSLDQSPSSWRRGRYPRDADDQRGNRDRPCRSATSHVPRRASQRRRPGHAEGDGLVSVRRETAPPVAHGEGVLWAAHESHRTDALTDITLLIIEGDGLAEVMGPTS